MPLSPARVLRQFRYAMYFDGVDDYVAIPRSPSLNVSSVSILAWVHQLRYYDVAVYIDRNDYYALGFSNGIVTSWLRTRPPSVVRTGATRLPLHWVFIGVTYDGIVRKHYVNGRLDAQWVENLPLLFYNAMRIIIGANGRDTDTTIVPPDSFVQTYIAQVLIYSRALTDSEIVFNYNNPDNPVRNGLVLWLQARPDYVKDIDGDGLLEWLDLSGFNNHGKIYGATLVKLIRDPVR